MIYLDLKSQEGRDWLESAHKPKRKGKWHEAMPRELLEAQVAQVMLADKEVHAKAILGNKFTLKAKARTDIDFAIFMASKVSALPKGDNAPCARFPDPNYVEQESEKCSKLWAAVIDCLALDTQAAWGCPKRDMIAAKYWFQAQGGVNAESRREVAELAGFSARKIDLAYATGKIHEHAKERIGRARWITRMENQQATLEQPDFLYTMGLCR